MLLVCAASCFAILALIASNYNSYSMCLAAFLLLRTGLDVCGLPPVFLATAG
jgi:hypothetical protein